MLVSFTNFIHRAKHALLALLNPNSTVTNALNQVNGVRNQKNRNIIRSNQLFDAVLALLLEEEVSYRECLINNEQVRLCDGSNCKAIRATIPDE